LLIFATAVGTAQGKRLGKARAKDLISEAYSFGATRAEKYVPPSPGAN